MASAPVLQPRRLAAEFLGSAFLAAVVIGPGIAAQRLSSGGTGLELLENSAADGHEAYCPGSRRIHMRFTGDRSTGQLLGVQLAGHPYAKIAKRIDVAATAIFRRMTAGAVSDLDLSCTAAARYRPLPDRRQGQRPRDERPPDHPRPLAWRVELHAPSRTRHSRAALT